MVVVGILLYSAGKETVDHNIICCCAGSMLKQLMTENMASKKQE